MRYPLERELKGLHCRLGGVESLTNGNRYIAPNRGGVYDKGSVHSPPNFPRGGRNDELQRLLAKWAQLRAQNRRLRDTAKRLRLDCEKARLDWAERLATMSDPVAHGEKPVSLFRNRALKAYQDIRAALLTPGWSDMDRQALEPRLNRLQLLFADLGIQESLPNLPGVSVAEQPARLPENQCHPDGLTKREREVLQCVAEGHSTKEVAEILGITFTTAACHRYRLMDKLDIHDTARLVRYAIRCGLLRP